MNLLHSPEQFVAQFLGSGLWHTTTASRFQSICDDEYIKVEPALSNNERHKTLNCRASYPYARVLGGVSLFDFSNFDVEAYGETYKLSNWQFFTPAARQQTEAVWIEIDRLAITSSLIEAKHLLNRWKFEKAYSHTIMPLIEACNIGDISSDAFRTILTVNKRNAFCWGVEEHVFKVSRSTPARS